MTQTSKASSELQAQSGRARAGSNGAAAVRGGGGAAPAGSSATPHAGSSVTDFAAALQEFLGTLLERQCRLVGAVAGVIYLGASGSRQASIGARYILPSGEGGRARVELDDAMLTRLTRFAADAGASAQAKTELINVQPPDAKGIYQPDPTHRVLACPLAAAEQVHGATVLVIPLAGRLDAADAAERVALTGASYEAFLWRHNCLSEAQTKTRLRETLELLDAAQQGEDAEAMGAIFCHELQRRFGCTRVSIGMIRGVRLRVVGVSGADDLDAHAAVVESIEAVMEECAEQDTEVVFPPPAEDETDPSRRRVTRAHSLHSSKHGPAAMLSLPLRVAGDLVGVVTLEREPADPFPAGAVPLLRLAAEFIGPALWTRRMADRGVLAVTRDRLGDLARATFGPRHTAVKAVAALVILAFALAAFVPIPGRVSADFETRAAVSRTVSPPFDGFLDTVSVKPGDRVEAGQVLASMDLKDTLLAREKALYTLQKLRTQQDQARAKGDQGEAAELSAEIEETQFEVRLHEDWITRGKITAPISGEVSRGDIEPLAGAKVEPSQPLFEIIASDRLVVVLQVKEQDIGSVRIGQEGRIATNALPDEKVPIKVVRIRPAAEAVHKDNVFFVEAELNAATPDEAAAAMIWLKPGMTGTARLESGRTTVLWELCRPVINAARMRLWW